jgi:orotidine-5'-phosphate decarboxylase
MSFYTKLNKAWEKSNSLVCIGLDPDLKNLPSILKSEKDPIFAFNKSIIEETADIVCAYKPQIAYYSGQGAEHELLKTHQYLRASHPEILSILDAKRGDIGSTAQMYAKEAFEIYGADSVTVNPFLGGDSIEPFTDYKEKGCIFRSFPTAWRVSTKEWRGCLLSDGIETRI